MTRRDRKHCGTRVIARQRSLTAVHEPVDHSELRCGFLLVAQEPLHAAAVESMRCRHAVPAAPEDDVERIGASAAGAFELKLDVAARWFDHEHDCREWILDEWVNPLARFVTHPVSLLSGAEQP